MSQLVDPVWRAFVFWWKKDQVSQSNFFHNREARETQRGRRSREYRRLEAATKSMGKSAWEKKNPETEGRAGIHLGDKASES